VYKEGAEAPPSWEKGGSRQFFDTENTDRVSFGIGMVNTKKYFVVRDRPRGPRGLLHCSRGSFSVRSTWTMASGLK